MSFTFVEITSSSYVLWYKDIAENILFDHDKWFALKVNIPVSK
jgi:hypothetical protein